ncbi:hypothetical protein CSE16_03535 [Solibacillus sp. R5-41]|uniref:DUF4179 domain-containing protein n=1 Tax=Solibacillus sp. R5-41 TaxID=2048654 RepID=UPI000C125A1D|nr:DUF4179 domain-containing protein [Solibacillus sp. R5-41]ATP39176.1 hypothetical protein CSE16_03535 [Solibacillus sp. R5-41]
MSMKEWMELDVDQLELEDVTNMEKSRVKQHVLKKRKKTTIWRKLPLAAILFISTATVTSFAFPSIASQLPFMDNVIRFFDDEYKQITNFETFSSEIGLSQTSNGMTVMIDSAVYDGTNVTVSFAIETEYDFGDSMYVRAPHWFDVVGASGSGGTDRITKISDTRYVGLASFTPRFKNDAYPETVEVTWKPEAFYNSVTNIEVEGDWSFAFSLDRLAGNLQTLDKTVANSEVSFTLQSIEYTDVSTVFSYNQEVQESLLKKWKEVTPIFYITDNLGNQYMEGTGGAGSTSDNYRTFEGTTSFGAIHEDASELIIKPAAIASLMYGMGHIEIELEPIVIDLK